VPYGTGPLLERLHAAGIDPRVKIQAPVAPKRPFTKDRFQIDLAASTVTCPAQHTAPIVDNPNPHHRHHGQASFGPACASCPLGGQCTSAAAGRTITITAYEQQLAAARARQADPDRAADYRATRPKVERKLAIWSAAATAAAACGSAALPRSPPTSTCWPPRSTWPGWAYWACTGPHRMAGQQHEPSGVSVTGSRAARHPSRHPSQPGQPHRVPRPCRRQHARPLRSLISIQPGSVRSSSSQ
jgi:Transposase DDE domain